MQNIINYNLHKKNSIAPNLNEGNIYQTEIGSTERRKTNAKNEENIH